MRPVDPLVSSCPLSLQPSLAVSWILLLSALLALRIQFFVLFALAFIQGFYIRLPTYRATTDGIVMLLSAR